MKYQLSICALVLLTISATFAQVASHAPTQVSAPQNTISHQPSGKPVARVNGAVLTDRDLQTEMFTMFPYARQHNGNIPPEMEPGIRNGALKMIIFEELVYQEAKLFASAPASSGAGVGNLLDVQLIEAVDVSNAIAWLVSDEARYVTAVALPVDAGFTAK